MTLQGDFQLFSVSSPFLEVHIYCTNTQTHTYEDLLHCSQSVSCSLFICSASVAAAYDPVLDWWEQITFEQRYREQLTRFYKALPVPYTSSLGNSSEDYDELGWWLLMLCTDQQVRISCSSCHVCDLETDRFILSYIFYQGWWHWAPYWWFLAKNYKYTGVMAAMGQPLLMQEMSGSIFFHAVIVSLVLSSFHTEYSLFVMKSTSEPVKTEEWVSGALGKVGSGGFKGRIVFVNLKSGYLLSAATDLTLHTPDFMEVQCQISQVPL